MAFEHPLTEYLDFTYSSFGKPEVSGNRIKLPVREFSVYKGFPGFDREVIFRQGILVFEGVVSSVRMIREYETPEGRAFKPEHIITDGPFDETNEEAFLF